jgi:hypothetical protein
MVVNTHGVLLGRAWRLGVVVEAVAVVAAAPLAAAAPLRAAAPVLPALGGRGGGARVKAAAVAIEGLRRGSDDAAKGTAHRATQHRRVRPGRGGWALRGHAREAPGSPPAKDATFLVDRYFG